MEEGSLFTLSMNKFIMNPHKHDSNNQLMSGM